MCAPLCRCSDREKKWTAMYDELTRSLRNRIEKPITRKHKLKQNKQTFPFHLFSWWQNNTLSMTKIILMRASGNPTSFNEEWKIFPIWLRLDSDLLHKHRLVFPVLLGIVIVTTSGTRTQRCVGSRAIICNSMPPPRLKHNFLEFDLERVQNFLHTIRWHRANPSGIEMRVDISFTTTEL